MINRSCAYEFCSMKHEIVVGFSEQIWKDEQIQVSDPERIDQSDVNLLYLGCPIGFLARFILLLLQSAVVRSLISCWKVRLHLVWFRPIKGVPTYTTWVLLPPWETAQAVLLIRAASIYSSCRPHRPEALSFIDVKTNCGCVSLRLLDIDADMWRMMIISKPADYWKNQIASK